MVRKYRNISASILTFVTALIFTFIGCQKDNPVNPTQLDPSKPTVSLLSPIDGDNVGDSVLVEIDANDDKGITKVEFIINNTVLKTWVLPPYRTYWQLSTLTDSTRYAVYARVYDADSNFNTSQVKMIALRRINSPTGLKITPVSKTSVELSWTFKNTVASSIEIERSISLDSPYVKIGSVDPSILKFTDNALDTNQIYYYRLKATRQSYYRYSNSFRMRYFSDGKNLQKKALSGHTDIVYEVDYSRDGQLIVSGGRDRLIKVWDANTGELIRTLPGHSSDVNSVAFSPDGQTIVSGGSDNLIKLWSTSTGSLIRTFPGHSDIVNSVAFSPDGLTLVSGSSDKNVKLWGVLTGNLIRTLTGHTSAVSTVSFSADGTKIVSGSADRSVKIWDSNTGGLIRTLSGHTAGVNTVVFSPDGQTILSGGGDRNIKIWNASTGSLLKNVLGHTGTIFSLVFSSNGVNFTSAGDDATIRFWTLNSDREIDMFPFGTNRPLKFAPNETSLLVSSGANVYILNSYQPKIWQNF